jgi:short-subunit dehydrogenase
MAEQQKFALITGATSGIGYELAKLFAKDKYNLIIVARNAQELARTSEELKQQYGIEVRTIGKDLFEKEAPFEVYDEVRNQGIQVDVLVNNAGQGQYGEFVETDINRELDIIQLNISAYVVLTKCFLKEMVQRNEGKILNVASIASKLPGPLQSVYHATKAFVLSFTEAIQSEIKDTNVTITSLMPGATDTDFFNKADMENAKLVQETKLSDPVKVAKDGYEALMSGDHKIISGLKNKAQVAMGNMLPDDKVANIMHKQMEPVDKKEE